jgi:(1->4)-alpha-D-glucan 1-alpha-D-glucosylmutase
MGLMRLFWVPPQGKPVDGAYVAYPLHDLVALLALESHRHRCLVIGEDLGTVPDEVRGTLSAADVLSYRVLLFERDSAGEFKPPSAYPEAALATASTHDLPTLAGWWRGRDIDVRRELGLLASDDEGPRLHAERRDDRARLLRALEREQLLPAGVGVDADADPALTPALAAAIGAYLARTQSVLAIVQFEDALLATEQANLPGTTDAHPNWRRKLPATLDEAFADPTLRALAARLRAERSR